MPFLRRFRLLTLPLTVWVLALFMASLGAMAVSSVMYAGRMELVCSASGVTKLLVQPDGGSSSPIDHTAHCPLCLLASAPPPYICEVAAFAAHSSFTPQATAVAPMAATAGAPLPARGPPVLA
jgi:hypothetical protein